jgi:hypothetical protein
MCNAKWSSRIQEGLLLAASDVEVDLCAANKDWPVEQSGKPGEDNEMAEFQTFALPQRLSGRAR